MSYFSTPLPKKRKPSKKTAAQRKLDTDWEAMLKAHAKPLEKGGKANGIKVAVKAKPKFEFKLGPVEPDRPIEKKLPVPLSQKLAGTLPITDPLAEAKHALKHRVGQAYNKSGISYLTDDELKEQRTGSHKRR